MISYRYRVSILILAILVHSPLSTYWAQKPNNTDKKQSESEVETFRKAQQELQRLGEEDRPDMESARKVEEQLWILVKHYPNSVIHEQAEEALIQAQEILAEHYLEIACIFSGHDKSTNLQMQEEEFWLVKAIYECPKFSRRDEALLAIAKLYLGWGRTEDAVKHLQKLENDYPYSKYANEAIELINKIYAGTLEDREKLKPE